MTADLRVLRQRQADLAADVDAARSARPGIAARRRLVEVVDGGRMPASADHWFLGQLLDVGGAESEGGAAASAVVGSGRIPFVALHHAPAVGDRVVIASVGGRWVGELGGCKSTVCVVICGTVPLAGALVEIIDPSGAVRASCTTTAASACCAFDACGTWRVRVTYRGTVYFDAPRTLSARTTIAVNAEIAPVVCCGGLVIPRTLYLTDGEGTIPLVFDPNWYYPIWTGGHSVTRTSAPVTMPTGLCDVGDASEGPVRVCYQLICHAGQTPQFTLQRSWSWVFGNDPGLIPIWYQDDAGFVPGQFCATAPPPLCGNPLTDVGTFDADPTSTDPFALAGTPAPAPGNATGDPVGGGVVISA